MLGGYDQSRFASTNISVPFAGDISRDLVVGVQSISVGGTSMTSSSGGFYAFVDSTIAQLYLPLQVCEAFESAFGLTWNSTAQLYLVNSTLHTQLLAQNASVKFTLGVSSSGGQTIDIVLPYSAFDLQVSYPIVTTTSYYFPLKRAANDTQYTLGRTFLQEAYLIADYERRNFTIAPCTWVQNAQAQIRTILSPNTSISNSSNSGSSFSAGAIAGTVIGIVVVIALVGLAIFFMRRKKQAKKQRAAELEGASKSQGDNATSAETKPFISAPIGGELGGNENEIHEIQDSANTAPKELDSPYRTDPGKVGYGELPGTAQGTQEEYYGKVPWGHHEIEGNNTHVYEMPGSEVQEMPTPTRLLSWTGGDEKKGLH